MQSELDQEVQYSEEVVAQDQQEGPVQEPEESMPQEEQAEDQILVFEQAPVEEPAEDQELVFEQPEQAPAEEPQQAPTEDQEPEPAEEPQQAPTEDQVIVFEQAPVEESEQVEEQPQELVFEQPEQVLAEEQEEEHEKAPAEEQVPVEEQAPIEEQVLVEEQAEEQAPAEEQVQAEEPEQAPAEEQELVFEQPDQVPTTPVPLPTEEPETPEKPENTAEDMDMSSLPEADSFAQTLHFAPIDPPQDAHIPTLLFHPETGYMDPETSPQEETEPTDPVIPTIPKVVFLVPYRNRETQRALFDSKMRNVILSDKPAGYYQIFYIHQMDNRPFNRGAMKNIGFLMVRQTYPDDYAGITLVFNDVDTTPNYRETIPSYETTAGVVKHFYGFPHALGGIVSILAGDFERINGFPNYWAWGFEDNMLNKRVLAANMTVDRSTFYPNTDVNNIQQMRAGAMRTVNSAEFDRYARNVDEGINTIRQLYYQLNEQATISGVIDVTQFSTTYEYNPMLDREFDTSKSNVPFNVGFSAKRRSRLNMVMS